MHPRVFICLIASFCTAAAHAQTYVPFPISSAQFNESRAGLIHGSTYPLGAQTLGGVPFNLGTDAHYCWTSGWGTTNAVQVATIPLSIASVTKVYMLMNTEAGVPGPQSYINVKFNGSAGGLASFNLIGGVDVRDYSQSTYTNTINGTTTINVFSNGQGQRMDRLVFNLPSAFLTQSLSSMVITDTGHSFGSPLQRGILFGATAEQIPEPASIALLAVGGLALLRRRRGVRNA